MVRPKHLTGRRPRNTDWNHGRRLRARMVSHHFLLREDFPVSFEVSSFSAWNLHMLRIFSTLLISCYTVQMIYIPEEPKT